jgi:lysozyme
MVSGFNILLSAIRNNTERQGMNDFEMPMMKTSAAGIEIIKRNEGCRLEAYLDTIADPPVWTIGYGDTSNVHPAMRITQQEAEDRLAGRLSREFEPGVLAALQGAAVSQPQFDAMVSLAWNIGVGGFKGSSVARLHRAGDYAAAASAFALWNRAGGRAIEGLTRRRKEEAALYLSASVGSQEPPNPAVDDIDADLLADLVRAVQRVVGTVPDGTLGPLTYAAVRAAQRRAR